MRKKILFITKSLERGGTERVLEDLISRLDSSLVEPIILCFGADPFSDSLFRNVGYHFKIFSNLKGQSFKDYWVAFVKFRPQVIFFVNGNLGLFPWTAYLAARLSLPKCVLAIEHLIAEPFPKYPSKPGMVDRLRKYFGWHARTLFKITLEGILCDRVICVSDAVRARLTNDYKFPENKTITIRNGIDLTYYGNSSLNQGSEVRHELDIDGSNIIVLCVARLSGPKRIDILLDAIHRVSAKYSMCKCIIIGDGPLEKELRKKTEYFGITDFVVFTGRLDEVRPYYEVADIFVLSSSREGLPLVLLEAMAYGIPCIATNVGGNSEAIAHQETGLIVNFGDPEGLAESILTLVHDQELRQLMGKRAKKIVHEYFDVNDSVAKTIKVLLNH